MSASAAAENADAAPAPAARGKKKFILIAVAVLLVLGLAGGGAAFFVMKKKAAERAAAEAEGGDAADTKAAKKKAERKGPPVFVPLETFTVNLADREVERYAQIGITLEVDDAKIGEQLKQYMPAIRNNILMVLAHKTSAELLEREGKTRLAEEVLRESIRPLGADTKGKDGEDAEPPVRAVHFSNFIIQ